MRTLWKQGEREQTAKKKNWQRHTADCTPTHNRVQNLQTRVSLFPLASVRESEDAETVDTVSCFA
jgi:hypothetical protein